jgi:drug/metabolite transporter (DMT)-like permease
MRDDQSGALIGGEPFHARMIVAAVVILIGMGIVRGPRVQRS